MVIRELLCVSFIDSCLEIPTDGGAWWAAVYGVAQSRTRLKRLSSSKQQQQQQQQHPLASNIGQRLHWSKNFKDLGDQIRPTQIVSPSQGP